MNKPIIVVGNGAHAAVLIEILKEQKRTMIGYTDIQKTEDDSNLRYLGTDDIIFERYKALDIELVLGIGTTKVYPLRKILFERFQKKGYRFASVIHPTAIVSPSVQIGEGVQIMAGAILQTKTIIGHNTIINTGTQIDHNCMIKAHVHIAPGSTLSGGVHIKEQSHIGTGATIVQDITIGKETTIGAGSVVVHDIGASKVAYGVPAKEVR